jgi:hypothetical protein
MPPERDRLDGASEAGTEDDHPETIHARSSFFAILLAARA